MKKIVSAILLLTVLISGCNLFKKNPQKAVDAGVSKFAEVKKMSSLLAVKGTIQAPPGEKPSKIVFTVEVSVKMDTTDKDLPKLDTVMKIRGEADDQKASGQLEFRTVDKKIYIRVGNVEISGEAGKTLNTQLVSVLNAWWAIPLGEKNPIGKLSKEQQELQELFKSTKFFINAMEDGEEELQGMKSTRYRVDLDKEALKKFIFDFARSTGNQIPPEEELALGDSLKDIEFSGAVWIGNDGYLHRVRGTIASQPAQGPSSSFDIDYSSWDYGKDVEVSAPEGVKDFSPLLLQLLLGAFGGLNQDAGGLPPGGLPPGTPIDNPLGAAQVTP
jgi:hypothetical protein